MRATRSPGGGGHHPRLRPGRRLLAVVLLACLLLGSAGGLMIMQSRDEMHANVMSSMDARAQFAATEVYGNRLGMVRFLQGVAGDSTVRAGAAEDIRRRLLAVDADAMGLTGGLVWLDRHGVVRAGTRIPAGATVRGDWLTEVLTSGGWTTSEAMTDPAFVGEVLVFAVATQDDTGAVNGVLAGGWGVDWLRRTAERRARETAVNFYGPHTDLLVVDRRGRLVVGPGVTATRDVRDTDLYRRVMSGREPFAHGALVEERGLSGRPGQVVAFSRMGPFGELVVLERPTRHAFAAPSRSARFRVAQLGLIVLLALTGAGLVGRRIDRLTRERDELHHAEHEVVVDVQRSLLTTTLPPGVTVRYLPAPSALNVGGDWYDAIGLPDGRIFLVVGDVVGHGVAAALAMGQIRTAARALAPRAAGP
ncbi:MAG TPA: SpoIIE family protein phosphatase, partial [Micromonospora sp.]